MKMACCVLGAMVAISLTVGRADAQTVIKAATEGNEGHIVHDTLLFLEQDLESRLPGEVDLQIFPGGQLGKDIDVLNGLRIGTHELTLSCSAVASLEPSYGVFEAPFLFSDRDQVREVIEGPVGEELLRRLNQKGVVGLALTELGFRQITNNVRPIAVPDDLEGLKIRIPNSPFRGKIFEQYGANPTPIPYGETYSALRQGVVDGQENPLSSIYGAKFHEVQKYISLSNHLFTPCTILASPSYFESWPANVQEAMRESAKAAAVFSFERGAELDEELLGEMRKTSEVNEVDSAAFREASRPLYDEVASRVGQELMDMTLTAVE